MELDVLHPPYHHRLFLHAQPGAGRVVRVSVYACFCERELGTLFLGIFNQVYITIFIDFVMDFQNLIYVFTLKMCVSVRVCVFAGSLPKKESVWRTGASS